MAAVLSGSQRGEAFGDNENDPRSMYVEHAFGFAQLFGAREKAFENALNRRMLVDKNFPPAKIRLYAPLVPEFLAGSAGDGLCSERRRFFLDRAVFSKVAPVACGLDIRAANRENIAEIDAAFGLVTRFWPDYPAFLANAHAVMVYADGQPASICYAAALENGKAEIDVLTLPAQRGRGFGFACASAFVRLCLQAGIEPLWDCFTNNAGSLALAGRLGFAPGSSPYQFFTIPR